MVHNMDLFYVWYGMSISKTLKYLLQKSVLKITCLNWQVRDFGLFVKRGINQS